MSSENKRSTRRTLHTDCWHSLPVIASFHDCLPGEFRSNEKRPHAGPLKKFGYDTKGRDIAQEATWRNSIRGNRWFASRGGKLFASMTGVRSIGSQPRRPRYVIFDFRSAIHDLKSAIANRQSNIDRATWKVELATSTSMTWVEPSLSSQKLKRTAASRLQPLQSRLKT